MRFLAPFLCLVVGAGLYAQEPGSFDVYERGRVAEKAGRMVEAYLAYAQAAALDPTNKTYWQRSQAVRFRATLEAVSGQPLPLPFIDIDAPEPIAHATPIDLQLARQALPPVELNADLVTRDFDLTGDSKKLFEEVTKAFGLQCIFDSDYQPVSGVRFTVQGLNYREALYALQTVTGSFVVPVNSKMLLVAKDTTQKRNEVEPMAAVAIPLPGAISVQDFNEIVRYVQQALALEKVVLDMSTNTVVIRDKISKVLPAQALLNDLLHLRGQLVIDMRLLEVSRNDMIQYGVNFPTSATLTPLTTYLQNQISLPTSLSGLLSFGGGKTLIGIGVAMPQMIATMSDSLGKNLYDVQLPAVEGQAVNLHLGERYPIQANGYIGPASFSGPGAYTPPPSFTYEDLGLALKVTSRLHGRSEATLDIDAEFKLLTGQTSNGVPIISNRTMKTNMRLKVGEWAMMSGLLTKSEAYTITGLAGFSRIPYLGALTSKRDKQTDTNEVLLLFRPRLIALPGDQFPTRTYRLGSETRPLIPL